MLCDIKLRIAWLISGLEGVVSINFINAFIVVYSLIYITSFPSDCIRFICASDLRKFSKMAFLIH